MFLIPTIIFSVLRYYYLRNTPARSDNDEWWLRVALVTRWDYLLRNRWQPLSLPFNPFLFFFFHPGLFVIWRGNRCRSIWVGFAKRVTSHSLLFPPFPTPTRWLCSSYNNHGSSRINEPFFSHDEWHHASKKKILNEIFLSPFFLFCSFSQVEWRHLIDRQNINRDDGWRVKIPKIKNFNFPL